MIHLDERLETAASFVRNGSVVADIGTDHGYLICSLAERGTIPRGYACDINEQPLAKAAETVEETGLGDKISLVLCDGLRGLDPNCADDIIIAGMGGELICSILSAADWVR
ncbi:MAG: SAM-dependent methyltransferase, partial [Oscillospiraceae bacterium]|nr:SAM-dependent methyltransferase [Oscillospiraceae bacterium]